MEGSEQPVAIVRTLPDLARAARRGARRLGRSLLWLWFRPGRLTARWQAGDRAAFLPPIALFLIATLLLAVAGQLGPEPRIGRGPQARTALAGDRARVGAQLARLDAMRAAANARKDWSEASALRRDMAAVRATQRRLDQADRVLRRLDDDRARTLRRLPETGVPLLDERLADAVASPDEALARVRRGAWIVGCALAPLTGLWLWLLLCWRRGFTLYDHGVAASLSTGFVATLSALLIALDAGGVDGGALALVALAAPPVHLVAQLRGGYALGWWSALWRAPIALLFMTAIITVAGAALALFGEALG